MREVKPVRKRAFLKPILAITACVALINPRACVTRMRGAVTVNLALSKERIAWMDA